jgi:DNA repair protein RecO (recombination protein O)
MLVKSEGIVIRTTRYSETSVITKIYTRLKGMLSFHIPGVFSPKSVIKPSFLQPLQVVEMDFYLKESHNLNKIKELKPLLQLQSLHFDIQKSSIGIFISEIISKTIKEEEANEELYDFIFKNILLLDSSGIQTANFPLFFMIQFTSFLGFYPGNEYSETNSIFDMLEGKFASTCFDETKTISYPESLYFDKLLKAGNEHFTQIDIPKNIRQNLLKMMVAYYQIHISGFHQLNSIRVLEDVFKTPKVE